MIPSPLLSPSRTRFDEADDSEEETGRELGPSPLPGSLSSPASSYSSVFRKRSVTPHRMGESVQFGESGEGGKEVSKASMSMGKLSERKERRDREKEREREGWVLQVGVAYRWRLVSHQGVLSMSPTHFFLDKKEIGALGEVESLELEGNKLVFSCFNSKKQHAVRILGGGGEAEVEKIYGKIVRIWERALWFHFLDILEKNCWASSPSEEVRGKKRGELTQFFSHSLLFIVYFFQ